MNERFPALRVTAVVTIEGRTSVAGGAGIRRVSVAASLVYLVFAPEGPVASLTEKTRAKEGFRHRKAGHSWQRSDGLEVTLLLPAQRPGNTSAGTATGNARREVVEVGGSVGSRHAAGPAGSGRVPVPLAGSPEAGLLGARQTALRPHGRGGGVGKLPGLGPRAAVAPQSAHTRRKMRRATQRRSPVSIPSQGPI